MKSAKKTTAAEVLSGAMPLTHSSDYQEQMFEDGHNRTGTNPNIRLADSYDEAVAHGDADFAVMYEPTEVNSLLPAGAQVLPDSMINPDEEGEPIGGTEEEIDAMEAEGKPVDRTDRMKY